MKKSMILPYIAFSLTFVFCTRLSAEMVNVTATLSAEPSTAVAGSMVLLSISITNTSSSPLCISTGGVVAGFMGVPALESTLAGTPTGTGIFSQGNNVFTGNPTTIVAAIVNSPSPVMLLPGAAGTSILTVPVTISPNTTSGTYAFEIFSGLALSPCDPTVDINLISSTASLTIIGPPTIAVINESCPGLNNGSITITPNAGTPPFQYSINGGETFFENNGVFLPLVPGTYSVVVKDSTGFTTFPIATSILAAVPISFSALATAPTCSDQSDGILSFIISGGVAPYTATVSNGITSKMQVVPGTGFEVADLQPGVWSVQIVDKNQCTNEGPVTLPAASQFYLQSAVITPISCMGAHDATIAVTIVGGTPMPEGFFYSIDSGETMASQSRTFIFVDVGPGPHVITVSDFDCFLMYTTPPIIDPALLVVTATTTPPQCVGQATGSIIVQASGGTAPYAYSIDGGATFQVSNEFTQVAARSYTVLVEDSHGCTETATAVVPAAPPIMIQSVVTKNPTCFGAAGGFLSITATGGTGTLTYSIDGGTTFTVSNVFMQLSAGPYFIVVRDSQGCRATTTAMLTQPSQLSVAVATKTVCPGGNTITVTASGGVPPYRYSINGGTSFTSSNIFTNLRAGLYSVVVIDSNGCTAFAVAQS